MTSPTHPWRPMVWVTSSFIFAEFEDWISDISPSSDFFDWLPYGMTLDEWRKHYHGNMSRTD